jgi:hypothetical protein
MKDMYIDRTVPFPNATQRQLHFVKHGHKFGAVDEFEYERMADTFMTMVMHPNIFECYRSVGTFDRIRLDGLTRFFGVAYNGTVLRTFHPRSAASIAAKGGPQGFVAFKCAEVI